MSVKAIDPETESRVMKKLHLLPEAEKKQE
jgi:hypothetical protein